MIHSLYLLRHSYAEPTGGKKDFDRELTIVGVNTVRALGRKMSEEDFSPDSIISSTALRARDTATNLTEELGISEQIIQFEDKIYEASVRELLEVVNTQDSSNKSVLLVGHNPTISFFAEYLTGNGFSGMEPCGLVIVSFKSPWNEVSQGSGIFVEYYHPNQ